MVLGTVQAVPTCRTNCCSHWGSGESFTYTQVFPNYDESVTFHPDLVNTDWVRAWGDDVEGMSAKAFADRLSTPKNCSEIQASWKAFAPQIDLIEETTVCAEFREYAASGVGSTACTDNAPLIPIVPTLARSKWL